jgi:hypothetical protein
MRASRLTATALIAGALTLGAAACGSSSDGSTGSAPSASTTAAATPKASIAALTGVDTAVAVDPAVLSALSSLGVAVAPTGSGMLTQTYGPTLDFPITGGNVKIFDPKAVTPYVQGIIHHDGSGLRFTGNGKTLTVQNFDIDPGTSLLSAEVVEMNNTRVQLFHLDGTDLKISNDADGHAKLDGTKVKLTSTAASALNTTFGVTAFQDQMLIGIAHITAS